MSQESHDKDDAKAIKPGEERFVMADEIEQCVKDGHHKRYGTSPDQSELAAGNQWWLKIAQYLRASAPSHERRITCEKCGNPTDGSKACALHGERCIFAPSNVEVKYRITAKFDTETRVIEGTLPSTTPQNGWKLVPEVPTEQMLDAGYEAEFIPRSVGRTLASWRAMLVAAPSAPSAKQQIPDGVKYISMDRGTNEVHLGFSSKGKAHKFYEETERALFGSTDGGIQKTEEEKTEAYYRDAGALRPGKE